MLSRYENYICGRKWTLQEDAYFASGCFEIASHSDWPNGFSKIPPQPPTPTIIIIIIIIIILRKVLT